uniref:GBF-interacting protein 1 N-terminal domain-containing protein n=1 Tax=Brassica campestris TaxID=3711 RepID=M4FE58_BRACM
MTTSNGGDVGSRVSIPADLLETFQNIREYTGKQHSDEDIFSVFKDCLNDPHETAQKLLFLDTFHEVKGKRERKKESLVPKTEDKGRNGRRNFASNYSGANNGRSGAFTRQSGSNHRTRRPMKYETVPVSNFVVQNGTQCAVDGTSKSSQQSSTSSQRSATSNCGSQSDQVIRSESAGPKGNNQSLLKSDVGERPHVTFPAHLQVAKMLENGLTFGSFDSNFVKETCCDNRTFGCDDSIIKSSHGTAVYGASDRKDISTFSQDDNEISNSAPETELALQSNQTVQLVEGSEVDKLNEESLPIKDIHQVGYVPEAPTQSHSLANLQASAMYNLSLQGQPLPFPTLHAGFTGIYQQTPPILQAPTISPVTEQPIGPPLVTNQQPQAAPTNMDNNY